MSTALPQTLLQHLITENVLNETHCGDILVSSSFRSRRNQSSRLSETDLTEISERVHNQSGDNLPGTTDPKFVATIAAIDESTSGLIFEDVIAASQMIRKIELSDRIGGIPLSFLPLGISELPAFIEANPASLIFCWRENSNPSVGLRDDLGQLYTDSVIPEWFGLGAIYGPTNAKRLQDQYDVTVAPTLLFCVDGQIDCRLVGHHNIETVINEIEILANTADLTD